MRIFETYGKVNLTSACDRETVFLSAYPMCCNTLSQISRIRWSYQKYVFCNLFVYFMMLLLKRLIEWNQYCLICNLVFLVLVDRGNHFKEEPRLEVDGGICIYHPLSSSKFMDKEKLGESLGDEENKYSRVEINNEYCH